MKNKITDLTMAPSSSQAAVMLELPDDTLMAVPRQATVSKTLRRHRKKVTDAANGDTPRPAIPKDLLFDIPESFVVFDSGSGDNRLILISCHELLDELARASMWLADGTFKVVPSVFFQLYTIRFLFGNGVCPAAIYCLLSDKSAATYERLHREVKNLIPMAAPSSILVDFEKAAMNSFSAAYTTATLRGCYFHLCQSVMRKVSEIGLKAEYENNEDARTFIRCLPALAFVPHKMFRKHLTCLLTPCLRVLTTWTK